MPDRSLLPGILKTVRMGYDGKGQVRVRNRDDVRAAFEAWHGVACVLEKMLPLAYEVSVLVARGADGAVGGLSDRRERASRRHPAHHHGARP